MSYFTRMAFEKTAAVPGIAVPTAKQWRAYARAWRAATLRQSR